jgi:hypothetical protein
MWNFLESNGTAAAVAYLPIVLVIPVPIALGVLTALSIATIALTHGPVLHHDVDANGELRAQRVGSADPVDQPGSG